MTSQVFYYSITIFLLASSFRAQREIFLAQRSNGECERRSSRSTQAILSLPHEYKVPLRRKRSLGSAFDDDTRGRTVSHSFSYHHVEGCPFGADLSSAFGAPLLQGAAQLSCKNAAPSQGLPPHRHFERSEKSSLHNGQRESVREAAKAPRRFYLFLMSTEYRYGVKDPSAPLSMTIREDGLSHIRFHSFT